MIVIKIVAVVVIMIGGFILGKYHERVLWNQLIREGKLPTPGDASHDHS